MIYFDVAAISDQRAFEEFRKRVFFYEERDGPYSVTGMEVRRTLHNHAWHETRAASTSSASSVQGAQEPASSRRLQSCAMCARASWSEDLIVFRLFHFPPTRAGDASTEDGETSSEESEDADVGFVSAA